MYLGQTDEEDRKHWSLSQNMINNEGSSVVTREEKKKKATLSERP